MESFITDNQLIITLTLLAAALGSFITGVICYVNFAIHKAGLKGRVAAHKDDFIHLREDMIRYEISDLQLLKKDIAGITHLSRVRVNSAIDKLIDSLSREP